MRDIVVLLPGITGSVLQKDGKDVWALSGQSLTGFVKSAGDGIKALRLPDDYDPTTAPNDGVEATRVFSDFHGVLGLGKIDGYSVLSSLIHESFDIVADNGHAAHPANYFEFPYDWRLSCRLNGERLQAFVNPRLHAWRKATSPSAKIVFLAHSMGGLVARYYLECLEGWTDCRALVTFGTPYRGALAAVNYLANGYKQLFIDLTDVLRTLPSVYELLPTYEALHANGTFTYVDRVDGLPHINRKRAEAASRFHLDIRKAVDEHLQLINYHNDRYVTYPFVGVQQPTLQSATFDGKTLTVSEDIRPEVVDEPLAGGDGTVPRVSATPLELSYAYRESFLAEKHGSLQNNAYLLTDLGERLKQLQSTGLGDVRGVWDVKRVLPDPMISLRVDDAYIKGQEPVRVEATVIGPLPNGALRVRIQRMDAPAAARIEPMVRTGDTWSFRDDTMPVGTYRVTVESNLVGGVGPKPVTDVIEIVDPA